MDGYGGMTPTLRRFPGPAADLVELTSERGLKHTAIVFHAEHRDHPTLTSDIQEFLGFMEEPDVDGLPKLVWHDPGEGVFVYPTGQSWSVAEVVKTFADMGKTAGVRAGLELAYHAGQILLEAATVGAELDVYSHTSLSPWNLLLKGDGQVRVIGFGIPQPEVALYVEDETQIPTEDSLRYCPPERLEGEEEDFTSDLFALALVAVELMTGKPVYDGFAKDILQQASRAEGQRKLYQLRDQLPKDVREVLARCLKYDPDARYQDGGDFIYGVHDLLSSPDVEGPGLAEVMQQVKLAQKKSKVLIGGHTGALTKEELAALAAELDEEVETGEVAAPRLARNADEPEPEPDVEQPRWGKVGRGRRRGGDEPEAPPAPAPAERGRGRGRLSRRSSRDESAEPEPARGGRELKRRRRGGDPESSEEPARGSRRLSRRGSEEPDRRLRRSTEPEEDRPRRRGRRRGEEAADEPSDSGRRRLRRSSRSPEPAPAEEPRRSRGSSSRKDELKRSRDTEDRPRRSRGRDSAPPPTPSSSASSTSKADALLERLRSSQDSSSLRESTPPSTPPPPKPRVLDETPPEPASGGDPDERIYFNVAVDGRSHRTKLKRGAPLAESAWRLAEALCGGQPTDLQGNLLGWYRITQNGKSWPGDMTTQELKPDTEIQLAMQPASTLLVDFEVKGTKQPTRFRAPVGTATPVRSLVAHLRRWLSLPAGSWTLQVEGKTLHPLQTLGEIEAKESIKVVVTQ